MNQALTFLVETYEAAIACKTQIMGGGGPGRKRGREMINTKIQNEREREVSVGKAEHSQAFSYVQTLLFIFAWQSPELTPDLCFDALL